MALADHQTSAKYMEPSPDRLYTEAKRRADEWETLFSIQQAITSRLDPDAVMQLITEAARRLTASERASLVLLEGDVFRIAAHSPRDAEKSLIGYRMPAQGSITELAVQSRKPIYITDAPNDPHVTVNPGRQALVDQVGIKSLMAVPLIADSHPLGAISISNKATGQFGPDDERVLMMLASSAVIGLENARLYHEEQERRQVAEGLRDILATLNSNRTLAEILKYIVAQAVRLLGTSGGAIYHLQAGQDQLVLQAACDRPVGTGETKAPLSSDQGPIGQAVSDRRPVAVPDLAAAGSDLSQPRLSPHYRALLAVPLIVKDEVYGSLALYFAEPRDFSEEEINLAVTFGDQAALAIENARLRQQVEQAAVIRERSRLARELHDSITQSLYSLTLLSEGWRRLVQAGQVEQVATYLTELGEIAQQALKEMRLLIHELRPLALEQEGLVGALQQRLDAVEGRAGVETRLLVENIDSLPAPLEEELYRIAQEALNNALKHACATSVVVRLRANREGVILEITDNGQGFDPQAAGACGGLGLPGMQERAEKLGGSLALTATPGEGARIQVKIPVDNQAHEPGHS